MENTLKEVRDNIKLCDNCFLPAQANSSGTAAPAVAGASLAPSPASPSARSAKSETRRESEAGERDPYNLCTICASPRRDKNTVCIVEKETDALNFEKTGQFQGQYYVLGGFIDPLQKDSTAHARLSLLTKKMQDRKDPLELILALTPRREGEFTSLYIEDQLRPLKEQGLQIKITRLGRGLSSGAELEYADEETIKNALEGRK